jgi:hypothetical protein
VPRRTSHALVSMVALMAAQFRAIQVEAVAEILGRSIVPQVSNSSPDQCRSDRPIDNRCARREISFETL